MDARVETPRGTRRRSPARAGSRNRSIAPGATADRRRTGPDVPSNGTNRRKPRPPPGRPATGPGGRPYTMTPAARRLAQAAMGQPETHGGTLGRELGIAKQTLYRSVGPKGEPRPDGEKLLARRRADGSGGAKRSLAALRGRRTANGSLPVPGFHAGRVGRGGPRTTR